MEEESMRQSFEEDKTIDEEDELEKKIKLQLSRR